MARSPSHLSKISDTNDIDHPPSVPWKQGQHCKNFLIKFSPHIEAISAIDNVLQNIQTATTMNIQMDPAVPPFVRPKMLVLLDISIHADMSG